MDAKKNTTAQGKVTTLPNPLLDAVTGKFEDEGALLSMVDGVRHLSTILRDTLERTFLHTASQEFGEDYVRITFSTTEVERFLWLASEISVGGERLNRSANDAYSALIEMGA